jgi:class 3 adenylate cyclase
MPKVQFQGERSESKDAIVVSFDLSGFSDFCKRADAGLILPKFLSQLFASLNHYFMGDFRQFWTGEKSENGKISPPDFIKFTGDGAIMIWTTADKANFTEKFCTDLVVAMRTLQTFIAKSIPDWEKSWRVHSLPQKARFGISIGTVYPMKGIDTPDDYVGYCINLAVRLQDHCRELGFLVHASLHPNIAGLIRLDAIKMKGADVEPIFTFQEDLKKVNEKLLATKFKNCPAGN